MAIKKNSVKTATKKATAKRKVDTKSAGAKSKKVSSKVSGNGPFRSTY